MTEPPSLGRTMLLLAPAQIVFRGLEAAMPLLFAAWFGRSEATDRYYFLASVVTFFASIVVSSFQDSAVIPVMAEVRSRQSNEVGRFTAAVVARTVRIGCVIAAVTFVVAFGYVTYKVSNLKMALLESAGFGVWLLMVSYRASLAGCFQGMGWLVVPTVATGTGSAFALVLLWFVRARFGIASAPYAFAVGELAAIVTLEAAWKRRFGATAFGLRAHHEAADKFFRLAGLESIGSMVTRINPVVDQAMAQRTGEGSATMFKYAGDVASVPTSILQAVLFTPLLSRLSHVAVRRDYRKFRSLVVQSLIGTAVFGLALSALLAWVREPLLRVLFFHGTMDEAGLSVLVAILPYALVGVVPFAWLLVLARAHVALQNQRIMVPLGVLNASLNVLFNLILVRSLGVRGLALATALVHTCIAAIFFYQFLRVLKARQRSEAV